MARNYEKRFTGLNRFLEAKQKEAKGDDDQPRPLLSKLYSAEDVKKWIPSIQREIGYLLQQISLPHESRNYSDEKVKEFQERVARLKEEHKRFVTKVQALDPSYKGTIPWQSRGYTRKRSHDQHTKSHDRQTQSRDELESRKPCFKKLCSPLIEKEEKEKREKMDAILTKTSLQTPNLLGLDYSDSESSPDET